MPENTNNNDRRKQNDRRTQGDRRRPAEGRRVVLEVCRSALNLSVVAPEARGDGELLLCRSFPWRSEASSLLSPGGAEELKIAIKQLAVEERLTGAAATVLLNGDLCVSRVSIGSSSTVGNDITELTERSQLYLALGPGEKAAATARFPLDARHEHAVLSVANQRTVNAVVRAAESAGLELQAVEASAVALCRTHGELYDEHEPVLLVRLDEDHVEIALSHRGRLLLEHRPGGDVSPQQIADVLNKHHGRLARYCKRPDLKIEGDLSKAYLCGDPALIEVAEEKLAQCPSLEFLRFDATRVGKLYSIRESPPDTRHASALGGLLVDAEAIHRGGPNLLERWIAESRKHIRPMLIRSAIPLAATLLLALGLWLANMQISHQNTVLTERLAQLRPAQLESDRLRLRLMQVKAKIEQLRELEEQTPHAPLAQFVSRVSGCLPNDVWLDDLQLSAGHTVAITGSSYTESGAYDFVSHLNRAPGLKQVALQETRASSGSEGPTTSFRVKASFTFEAPPDSNDSIASTAPRAAKPASR